MKLALALAAFALTATACRTTSRDANDAALEASGVRDQNKLDPACTKAWLRSDDKRPGAELFEFTNRCFFDRADRNVHTVRVQLLAGTFAKILSDGAGGYKDPNGQYGHVIDLIIDEQFHVPDVGMKVRGNTSKSNEKRQFSFKFDATNGFFERLGTSGPVTYTDEAKGVLSFPKNKDRTVFGLSGLSVRSGANDDSMIREHMASQVFEAAEVDPRAGRRTGERGGLVYRTTFGQLFVTLGRTARQGAESVPGLGDFNQAWPDPKDVGPDRALMYDRKGFYTLTENVDKAFLHMRFDGPTGKLGDFHFVEADKAEAQFDRAKFEQAGWSWEYFKGDKVEDDATRKAANAELFKLFDALAPGSPVRVEDVVDVGNVANYVAGALLVGHWDSLLTGANNDFLYFNPKLKKWQIVVWDLDNTWGVLGDQLRDKMQPLDDVEQMFQPARAKPNAAPFFGAIFGPARLENRRLLVQRLQALIDGPFSDAALRANLQLAREIADAKSDHGWEFHGDAYDPLLGFGHDRRDRLRRLIAEFKKRTGTP
jgi:spore coat protein CotH